MGPYCNFCNRRCFLVRRHPKTGVEGLFATCQAGMAHDREQTGYDYTTAISSTIAALALEKVERVENGADRARTERSATAARESIIRTVLRILGEEHSDPHAHSDAEADYVDKLLMTAARQLVFAGGAIVACTCGQTIVWSTSRAGWRHTGYLPDQPDWDHDPAPADRFVDGWMAARMYYGSVDSDTGTDDGPAEHGAECDRARNDTYPCTCNEAAERAEAADAGRVPS